MAEMRPLSILISSSSSCFMQAPFLFFLLTSMTLRSFPTPAASSDHSWPVHACCWGCFDCSCCFPMPLLSVAGVEAEEGEGEEGGGGAKRLSNAATKRLCSSEEKGCLDGGKEDGVDEKDKKSSGDLACLCPSFPPSHFSPAPLSIPLFPPLSFVKTNPCLPTRRHVPCRLAPETAPPPWERR
jgi:hypothetical protein